MIRELERGEIDGAHFFKCLVYVTILFAIACMANISINEHYDNHLCTNPYYEAVSNAK